MAGVTHGSRGKKLLTCWAAAVHGKEKEKKKKDF